SRFRSARSLPKAAPASRAATGFTPKTPHWLPALIRGCASALALVTRHSSLVTRHLFLNHLDRLQNPIEHIHRAVRGVCIIVGVNDSRIAAACVENPHHE